VSRDTDILRYVYRDTERYVSRDTYVGEIGTHVQCVKGVWKMSHGICACIIQLYQSYVGETGTHMCLEICF